MNYVGLELYFCLLDQKHTQSTTYHDASIDQTKPKCKLCTNDHVEHQGSEAKGKVQKLKHFA